MRKRSAARTLPAHSPDASLLGQNVAGAMGTAAKAVETAVGLLTTAINALLAVMEAGVGKSAKAVADMLKLKAQMDASIAANPNATMGPSPNVDYTSGMVTAPSGAPVGIVGPSIPSTAPPSGPVPYDPAAPSAGQVYSTTPGTVGYKKPLPEFAIGGIAGWPQIARLAERFQEAIIPMPPDMNPDLRSWLTGLAQGGWRRKIPGGGWGGLPAPHAPAPTFSVPRGGLLALGTGGLGRTPSMLPTGGTTVHVNVTAPVSAGLVTSENELGDEIARISTLKIRDALLRFGIDNVNIWGGRG